MAIVVRPKNHAFPLWLCTQYWVQITVPDRNRRALTQTEMAGRVWYKIYIVDVFPGRHPHIARRFCVDPPPLSTKSSLEQNRPMEVWYLACYMHGKLKKTSVRGCGQDAYRCSRDTVLVGHVFFCVAQRKDEKIKLKLR